MGPKPLRPTSVPVPWPGHWHFSSGSPYFRRPFDADAYAATKRYLAMESLRVPTHCPTLMWAQARAWTAAASDAG